MNYTQEIEQSLRYLNSDIALESIAADPYWPKWDGPWWHMLLLHEMGLVGEIPEAIVSAYVKSINRMPLKIFPIQPEDMPAGIDPYRDTPCHCQLGAVYQVLSARGVEVDQVVPWIRPWLLRYQMADGGFNCDNEAYRITHEVASSMVGTIGAFEAILLHTHRPWTVEESTFLQKGAEFLMNRKLMNGSSSTHNAEERTEAKEWLEPCFPRFYYYDVIRGLNALLIWAEKTRTLIPTEAVAEVVQYLNTRFPDGLVRNERQAYLGANSFFPASPGVPWVRRPATYFPLLEKVSGIGEVSPFLSQQWADSKLRLMNHKNLRDLTC